MATALAKYQLTDGAWRQVGAAVRFAGTSDDPTGEQSAKAAGERWVAEDPEHRQYRLDATD